MSDVQPAPEAASKGGANRRRVIALLVVAAAVGVYIIYSIATYDPNYVEMIVHADLFYLKSDEGVKLVSVECPPVQEMKVGKPALDFVTQCILHKRIDIDPGQWSRTDVEHPPYILAWVFYADASGKKRFLNEELLRRGYGWLRLADPNLKYRRELEAAQAEAKEKKLGVWAPDYAPSTK